MFLLLKEQSKSSYSVRKAALHPSCQPKNDGEKRSYEKVGTLHQKHELMINKSVSGLRKPFACEGTISQKIPSWIFISGCIFFANTTKFISRAERFLGIATNFPLSLIVIVISIGEETYDVCHNCHMERERQKSR